MSKTKLFIIHGWTYTVAPWEETIALLEKKDISVEMLHVPGLTTNSRKTWTIEEYVKWADRNIPDGAIALGHSNGGRILLNLCSAKPEKLKHLILLDAAGVYESSSKRDFARTLSKKLAFLKQIPGLTKVWHKLTGATDYAKAPANMKVTLSNMLESDKKLDLSSVTTPTSILWGEADVVTPVRQAEVMHAQLPNNTLKIYPEWTHAPYIAHPKELADAIIQALKHPPRPELATATAETIIADDASKVSAALAIKRAEKPTLKASSEPNSIAPDVPTKLTLRKGGRPTEGIVITDEEGAAVKYEAKISRRPKKITDTAKVSAALAIKKGDTKPSLLAKKSKHQKKSSLSTKSTPNAPTPEVLAQSEVSFVELDPITPKGIISSADIAKPKKIRARKPKLKSKPKVKSKSQLSSSSSSATISKSHPGSSAAVSQSSPKSVAKSTNRSKTQ